jgi:hypothetical protein
MMTTLSQQFRAPGADPLTLIVNLRRDGFDNSI